MSLLSRVSAPPATHSLADLVASVLADGPGAPSTDLLRLLADRARPPAVQPVPTSATWSSFGPTGLGTSSLRLVTPPAGVVEGAKETPPAGRSSVPQLYCPPALRDDRALGEVVDDRLIEWAAEVGIYAGRLDRVRASEFGRLIMLAHPETDDPERLLAAAKCALSEWAVDDYYVDDESVGADPLLLGERLSIANGVVDPVQLPVRYISEFEEVVRNDPVLVALRSSLDNLAHYASWTQMARVRQQLALMFVAYDQEAGWRASGRTPPVWEYLLHRHQNSFLPCMVLVDAIAGYEIPPLEFVEPHVRRAYTLAGTASVIVNDLYSMGKEDPTDTSLPTLIAREEKCSLEEAVARSVEIHDELVHTFEEEAAALTLAGSPALGRFLGGLWAWLGGNREWHSGSGRYNATGS